MPDYTSSDEKLAWLTQSPLSQRKLSLFYPDKRANWIETVESDWDSFLPLVDKKTKNAKVKGQEQAVFKLYSLGVSTNRDEWVYGRTAKDVTQKCEYLLRRLDETPKSEPPEDIKLSRNLKRRLTSGWKEVFASDRIGTASYRPFDKRFLYRSGLLIDEAGSLDDFFPSVSTSQSICFNHAGARSNPCVFACSSPPDLHFGAAIDAYQYASRYRYASTGEPIDNITDWALAKFTAHYGKAAKITKEDIFHYVYGVLHDPVYRTTYAQNLKRELPRVPLYPDFRQWAGWGKRLMALHIGYEGVDPWPVTRTDTPDTKASTAGVSPKVILKSDPATGTITLDSETVISGIPTAAWDYRLGNRSGLDWILDQHKEKTPKDPTIREKFNTFRFADHKEKVADLIARVTRVSVETVEIVEAMKGAKRDALAEAARGD